MRPGVGSELPRRRGLRRLERGPHAPKYTGSRQGSSRPAGGLLPVPASRCSQQCPPARSTPARLESQPPCWAGRRVMDVDQASRAGSRRVVRRMARMAQAAERLGFDLAHALARDAHLAPDLLQRVRLAVEQAVAQLQDAHLARREHVEDFAADARAAGCGSRSLPGRATSSSSMKSPRTESSSSSVGVSSESGRRATWIMFSTFLGVTSSASASSSIEGRGQGAGSAGARRAAAC